MASVKVLLADTDEKYLIPLERKFIEGLGNRAQINVITDPAYLKTFFSTPKNIDILLINEELYDKGIERHDIAHTFLLTEQSADQLKTGNLDNKQIYKYTSVKEIYNEVIHSLSSQITSSIFKEEEARVIVVYSNIGGIGKTSVAAGLCGCLVRSHKRALYLSADSMQSFGWIMSEAESLGTDAEKAILAHSSQYDLIKPFIYSGSFDILPPFQRSLVSLGIHLSHYIRLVSAIKASNDYQYIVIDVPGDFSEELSALISGADHTVIVVGQDRVSAHKLKCLLHNIDCSDPTRFCFVCNRYSEEKPNALVSPENITRIDEYIPYDPRIPDSDTQYLSSLQSLQKLALLFIS